LQNDTSNMPRPSFTYTDTGTYTVKLVVNRYGFCPDSATMQLRVYPGLQAAFNVSGVCVQQSYQFTDQSSSPNGTITRWRWNFGDGSTLADTSLLRNPSYQYPQAGPYNATLWVENIHGCRDSITNQVVVRAEPLLNLAFRDTLICRTDTLQLMAQGQGQFTWTPNSNISNPNIASPRVYPTTETIYRLTVNDAGCIGTDSVRVRVTPSITASIGPDTTICATDAITLTPVTDGVTFAWEPPGLFANPNQAQQVVIPTASPTVVTLRTSLGACSAVATRTITTVPYPQVQAAPDTAICFGSAAQVYATTTGSQVLWQPATGLANPGQLSTRATPLQSTTYVIRVTDTLGCPKPVFDSMRVTVRPPTTAFAGNDTSLVLGQPLVLQGQSNAPILQWQPAGILTNATSLNPTLLVNRGTPLANQPEIPLTLLATAPEGCDATDEIKVRLFTTGPSIFVPSGFTPNGDGKNDIIRPILAGMESLTYFRIFNRYGQLVFETKRQNTGWDGRLNGLPQASGAYVYQAQAIDYQGNVVKASGTFVLIR
ncbi:MAG TPA: PKD domain-containing protein, partial [Phnomibacter sp.]|nr:PKD domain-containing protein [Phnomibacter sp.]